MSMTEQNDSFLDLYQIKAVDAFRAGKHVAVSGGAGIGKSCVIGSIITAAKEEIGESRVAACAPTNNAAKNIGGVTIHRLFGAKVNSEWSGAGLWNEVTSNVQIKNAPAGLDVLVIDEICTVN